MAKHKREKVKVSFVGTNADSVTGSCTLIEYMDTKILLECGLYQSNNIKSDYEINTRKFNFKPKEIDYVFLGHAHIDHIGLVPRLYSEGCNAKIITTEGSLPFIEPLLKDSAFIMNKDAETLSKRYKKEYTPIYDEEYVNIAMENARGYDYNNIHVLDDVVSFKFIPSGHIIGGGQLVLFIKETTGRVHKILYTSDLGNIQLPKPYVKPFEKETKANIVIAECTYGSSGRVVKKKDRDKDIEKLKSVIAETCVERGAKVLIPSFSLDRTQYLLTLLYELFSEDENFDIPIYVDSPLSCKMTNIYREVLKGEDKELIEKVCNWKNIRFISEVNASKAVVADKKAKIVIASSGMMTAGRVINHLESMIGSPLNTILFCGFSAQNTLASAIKSGTKTKEIKINGKKFPNNAKVVDLRSFSSHIQREDMLMYYKQISCESIYLVHGEMNGKIELSKDLKSELEKINKTTKVCVVNKGTQINL